MKNGLTVLVLLMMLNGQACAFDDLDQLSQKKEIISESFALNDSEVIWAVNIGGGEYNGKDGIHYSADNIDSSVNAGVIDTIKGAQDYTVYQSYRTDIFSIKRNVPNGIYDVVFRFAEPENLNVGERIFDVLAEGKILFDDLDVRLARDGNIKSSLDRTALNIEVTDGSLDLEFTPITGRPLLNALVIRKRSSFDESKWKIVWQDEFNDDGKVNPDKWNHDIWPPKKVNDEEQSYTSDERNVRVSDGKLILEAHHQDGNITSGRINTLGKLDLLYGRVAISAKLPSGQGTWPAIWMLPSNPFKYATTCEQDEDWQGSKTCDAWPNSGEIDIMEHVGYDMNIVHGTVHTKAYYWVNGEQRKASVRVPEVSEQFREYSLEWSENRIDVYIDQTLYFTYLKQSDDWQSWPFGHPFHLILNVAIGGGWGSAGGPTDLTALPTQMEVDYVRVYKPK